MGFHSACGISVRGKADVAVYTVTCDFESAMCRWCARGNINRRVRLVGNRSQALAGRISVDSKGYLISDPRPATYFPNSITNWKRRLQGVGTTERNYLPLWMRSIQPGGKQELDFQLALPICYCKLGAADDIILNIKYSGFDFKTLEYTVDRYIIDSVEGYTRDKYLVFRNDRITI